MKDILQTLFFTPAVSNTQGIVWCKQEADRGFATDFEMKSFSPSPTYIKEVR